MKVKVNGQWVEATATPKVHGSSHAPGGEDELPRGLVLEGYDASEYSTQSTSLVDIATLSGLNIPASKGIRIEASLRYIHVATSAGGKAGLKLNSTVVKDPEFANVFTTAASASGRLMWDLPPRSSDYLRGGLGFLIANTPNPVATIATDADFPTGTITSIAIRGRVLTQYNTLYVKNLRVYSYDP